jgi:hypothetical protein
MHHAQLTELVRTHVARAFAELCGDDAGCDWRESILIRDGSYCGRRFDAACGHAIWFVEESQLKVYDSSGAVLQVLEIDDSPVAPLRIAA